MYKIHQIRNMVYNTFFPDIEHIITQKKPNALFHELYFHYYAL